MKKIIFVSSSFILVNLSFFAQTKPSTINGDFDGNKTKDKITIYESKPGTELPAQLGGESAKCDVKTTLINIQNIDLLKTCGKLINEGDLDGNGSEEFSLISWSPNGTQVSMDTYKIEKGKLVLICSPIFEPGIGPEVTNKMLNDRVYKKNGRIYYIDYDYAGFQKTKQVRK